MNRVINFNPLPYTAACEAVWAIHVLLLILAFCQQMALHVIYNFKDEKTIYRMVYHTYRLYRFLGYKSICTA
jgi:predicted membrane protein